MSVGPRVVPPHVAHSASVRATDQQFWLAQLPVGLTALLDHLADREEEGTK